MGQWYPSDAPERNDSTEGRNAVFLTEPSERSPPTHVAFDSGICPDAASLVIEGRNSETFEEAESIRPTPKDALPAGRI